MLKISMLLNSWFVGDCHKKSISEENSSIHPHCEGERSSTNSDSYGKLIRKSREKEIYQGLSAIESVAVSCVCMQ